MSEKETRAPPCLDAERCPRAAACLENSKLCHELGRVGSYQPCGIQRGTLMRGVAVTALLGLLFNVYALFALSTHAKIIRAAAWGIGNTRKGFADDATLYYGLNAMVAYNNGENVYHKRWSRIDCHDYSVRARSANMTKTKTRSDIQRCKNCKSELRGWSTTVTVSAIASLVTLRYALKRSVAEMDRNCYKAMGIIVGCIAFATALGPMLAFRKTCLRARTSEFKMQDGPGYICMVIACVMKSASIVAHLALRAPGDPASESVTRRLAWISMDST